MALIPQILLKRSAVQGKVPPASASTGITTGELGFNTTDGKLYAGRNSGGASVIQINPVIQSASTAWQFVSAVAPIETFEFDDRALLFSQGSLQQIVMYLRVRSSYLTGSQINLNVSIYSPGTSNFVKFQTVAYLIRKATDAVTSVANSRTSTLGDTALSTANLYLQQTLDITSTTGTINAVAVNPGDMIKIVLGRVAPTGTEDTNDVRLLPGTTEIVFS